MSKLLVACMHVALTCTDFCCALQPVLICGHSGAVSKPLLAVVYSAVDMPLCATGALNIIDFVSILPFYIERIVGSSAASGSAVFRVVRLVRVFRVFKISRYLTWVKIFAAALVQSWQPLAMLVFVMGIATVVFSSALYFVERDTINPRTGQPNVRSIPDAFWWCIITMTTGKAIELASRCVPLATPAPLRAAQLDTVTLCR